jgi:hypothetical protein
MPISFPIIVKRFRIHLNSRRKKNLSSIKRRYIAGYGRATDSFSVKIEKAVAHADSL